jgi:hypothetical protein
MKPNHTNTGTTHGTTRNHPNGERGCSPPPKGGTTHTPNRNRIGGSGRPDSIFVAGKHWPTLEVANGLQSTQEARYVTALGGALGTAPAAYTVRGGWR